MMKGRYLNEEDIKNKTKYAVIGRLVEARFVWCSMNAIGEYIDIAGSAFKVIGVFQDDGGDNEERQYLYPIHNPTID